MDTVTSSIYDPEQYEYSVVFHLACDTVCLQDDKAHGVVAAYGWLHN